jgi:hypothetical protein
MYICSSFDQNLWPVVSYESLSNESTWKTYALKSDDKKVDKINATTSFPRRIVAVCFAKSEFLGGGTEAMYR